MPPRSLALFLPVLLLAACKDLSLPPPPDPAHPGTVSGRAVAARAGLQGLAPLPGARVELLGAGVSTRADDGGYFRLEGIRTSGGGVLFSADLDGDGAPDRQTLLALDALRAGPGRDVSLGDVQLVQNASVRGQVRLGDVASAGGHAGTLAFVPEGPFTATTSDDGSFVLPALPEGTFTLSFFRAGYQTASFDRLALQGGQELSLRLTTLVRQVSTPDPVGLAGRVLHADGGPATGAQVALAATGVALTTLVQGDGGYAFSPLAPGVYGLAATLAGSRPAVVSNLLLLSGTAQVPDLVLVPGAAEPAPDAGPRDAGAGTAAGQTLRVRVVPFAAGAGCAQAGYRLEAGLDADADGQLDPEEVSSSQVVCLAPTVSVSAASAAACPGGGVVLQSWVDANLDGRFQAGEAVGAPTTLCGSSPAAPPDGGAWTWVAGSDLSGALGTYGTQGSPSPGNAPGARAYAVSGNLGAGPLRLFGGLGYASAGATGFLNDLWSFDGAGWTWVSGADVTGQAGVYGTRGVPAAANVPGARLGAVSWTGSDGTLWLFGGNSPVGLLNDLWHFDGTSWTWVSGSSGSNQQGVYGTRGVTSPGSVPGARVDAQSWIDPLGTLWLFGGTGLGAGATQGALNDLWRFDGTSWTWVSGSTAVNAPGVYGTQGVPDAANVPSARAFAMGWVDANGRPWLFGGQGPGFSHLNDLWRFDGAAWTWMAGSSQPEGAGVYGTLGVPAAASTPGGRWSAATWKDPRGAFWLYGGYGLDASGVPGNEGHLPDLWRWDGTAWAWMGGAGRFLVDPVYGVKGVPGLENQPGGRAYGAAWTDAAGDLWLFGGQGASAIFNDLWRYHP